MRRLVGQNDGAPHLALLQYANHLQRLQRVRFQRFFKPIEVRLEAAATGAWLFLRLDLGCTERIQQSASIVRNDGKWFDLRKRQHPPLDILTGVLHPLLDILMLVTTASSKQQADQQTQTQCPYDPAHFLSTLAGAAPFLPCAAAFSFFCLDTSASSR